MKLVYYEPPKKTPMNAIKSYEVSTKSPPPAWVARSVARLQEEMDRIRDRAQQMPGFMWGARGALALVEFVIIKISKIWGSIYN